MVEGGAEGRLHHGEVHAGEDVVAVPLEQLVRRHPDAHVQVAGARAPLARSSLARHPDALARRRCRPGSAPSPCARPDDAAGAPALGAGLLDDLPGARAAQAHPGLDELSEHGAPDGAHLAATAALGAGLDRGGIGRAHAFTGRRRRPGP